MLASMSAPAVMAPTSRPTTGNIAMESFRRGGSTVRTKGTGKLRQEAQADEERRKGPEPAPMRAARLKRVAHVVCLTRIL